jgi:hypothetical protein
MDAWLIPSVALVVFLAIVWFGVSMRRQARLRTPERQLERMVGSETAERLIRFEREREPGLSTDKAAQRALERAEYDRGR